MTDTQINVGMNVDGVVTGTEKIKRSLRDVGSSARDAGKGTGAIGDGMAGSAQKVEAATKNMVGSIQRQIAALEAGDKSSRQYQESLARMRGIDTAALKPYLDQLDAVKAKQDAAAASVSQFASVGAAAGLAIAGMAAGFVAMAKGAIDAADNMNDLSQRVGIAVADLAKYELATSQSGTSMEAFAKGMKGLSVNLMEHGDALNKVGITAKDADGAMRQFADKFASMPDGVEKTTLAVKAFGKSGMDLIPTLNLGSAGLELAAQKAAKYAEQMAIMAPLADAYNDNLAELAMASKVAGMSIVNDMLPGMVSVTQAMAIAAQESGGLKAAWVALGGIGWELIFKPLQVIWKGINNTIDDANASLMRFFKQDAQSDMLLGRIAQRNKEILALTAENDRPAVDVKPSFDTAKWKAEYKALMDALGGGDNGAQKALDATNRELKEQAKLLSELAGLTGSFSEDWARLTAIYKSGKLSLEGLTKAQADLLAKQPAIKAAHAAEAKALSLTAKAIEEFTNLRDKEVSSQEAAILKIEEKALAMEDEVRMYGMSREAVESLSIARLQERADILAGLDNSAEQIALIEKEIAARKRLAIAKDAKSGLDAGEKAAKEAAAEWQKTADKINDSITDALMRGFESGKGFAENLRDTVVNMFKTMVLRPTVSAIVNPVAQGVTGMMGIPGANNAASTVNGISNLASIGGAGFQLATGSLAGASAASLGYANAVGAVGGDAIGALIAGNGGWAGVSTAAAAGEVGALGSAAGAGSGTLSSVFSAIPGWGWAALGAAAIIGLQDHGKPTSSTGDASASFDAQGNRTAYQTFFDGSSAAVDKMLTGLQSSYASAAKALGIGTVASQFAYGGNTGKNGESPNFALTARAGNSSFTTGGETASSDAAISLAASRAVFAALQGSDLPQYLSKVFDGVTADALSQEQITGTLAYAASLKQVRDALLETREPLQILKDNVAQGTAALSTSAETFKTDFVAALDSGITPDKLAQWQGLQGAMDQLSQVSGKATEAVASVGRSIADIANERTRLQDQLDELTLSSAQLLDKQRNAVDSSNRSLFDQVQAQLALKESADAAKVLAETNKGWQDQLAVLTGAQTERSIALRDAVDDSTKSLMEQVYAQQDLKTAMEDAAVAMKAMVSASQSITLSKNTLAGKSALENGVTGAGFALDNAIQAIKDLGTRVGDKGAQDYTIAQIESVNLNDFAGQKFAGEFATLLAGYWDAKVGVQSATAALANAATVKVDTSAADAISNERKGLQDQYDQLTMSSIDLMLKQRAALDESNRALFDSIMAIKMQSAAEANAAALKKANQGWQDQLDVLTGARTQAQVTRANELAAATNDSTKALMQQVYAQQDLNAATEATTKAAKDAADAEAARLKAIADQTTSLTTEWLQLIGDTVALRKQELAAIDESNRALKQQIWAYQDAKDAVTAATSASDNALSGIQKALDAQKAAQTKAVDDVKGLFDLVAQSVKDLYSQVDTARAMQAAEAQAFIATAATLAKAGGTLPDQAALGDAIASVKDNLSSTQYASQADADFAKLVLAGQLKQIQDVAGTKLTDAQQLLATTNDAYEVAKTQLDTLRGINDSTLSVAAAVEAFQVAYTGEQTARQKLQTASAVSTSASAASVGRGQYNPDYESGIRAYALINLQSARDQINLLSPIVGMGERIGQLQAEITSINASLGVVPHLASGTNYMPHDGLAYLHKGESVTPVAYNPAAGGSSSARLEALVEGLTKEVQRLQAIVNDGNRDTRRTADAVNGNPEMPMLVEAVA